MSKTFTLRSSILAFSLLAASGFTAAADEAPNSMPPSKHAQHRHFDLVAHTQRSLDRLAKKLNLNDGQQAAWQTYADNTVSRARERTAHMQQFQADKGEARANVDMATRLDTMSQAMRDRADQLQKAAQDTRAFENVLSPEQKTIFDLYWKAQSQQRMGHRPRA